MAFSRDLVLDALSTELITTPSSRGHPAALWLKFPPESMTNIISSVSFSHGTTRQATLLPLEFCVVFNPPH